MSELDLTAVNAIAIVPLILALVQLVKMVLPERAAKFSPIFALGFGLLASFLFNNDKMDWDQIIMAGIVYGLSSSGLYSGTKATAHAMRSDEPKGL